MVLLDTSAWVHYFRKGTKEPERFKTVLTCPPVIQEILQGIGNQKQHLTIRAGLLALPCLANPVPLDLFLEASEIFRAGRKKGFTIRSSTDCLIAAIAIENQVPVVHSDRDFDAIARFTRLAIESRW